MQLEKFEQMYEVRSYECDKNRQLKIAALFNIFQDLAVHHADKLGVGYEFLSKTNSAWVGVYYHLKIEQLPKVCENIKIVTWPSEKTPLLAVRDFMVEDEHKKLLITATSQWALIDMERRRPLILQKIMPQYEVIDDKALVSDFAKLPEPERHDVEETFLARFDDVDLNGHVNNAVYPLWATESVGKDFRNTHSPKEILIAFKKETLFGEKVKVL